MDWNVLLAQSPNLAAFIVAVWYLVGQNKHLQDQLDLATEARLSQLEKVITALNGVAISLAAFGDKFAALSEKISDMRGGNRG